MTFDTRFLLFRDASLMQAIQIGLKAQTQKVVYDGRAWIINGSKVTNTHSQLNIVQIIFLKSLHFLRSFLSNKYDTRFKILSKKCENAWVESQKVAQSAMKANQAMMNHEGLKQQLSQQNIKLSGVEKELEEWNHKLSEKQREQQTYLEKINAEIAQKKKLINELQDLKKIIPDYLKHRTFLEESIKRRELQVIHNFKLFFKSKDNYLGQLKENLNRLKKAYPIFNSISLDPNNPLHPTPFINKLDQEILLKNGELTQLLKNKQERLKIFDTEIAKIKETITHKNDERILIFEEKKRLENKMCEVLLGFEHIVKQSKLKKQNIFSPTTSSSQEKCVSSIANVPTLNRHAIDFLATLEKISSPKMSFLWKSLLTNVLRQLGHDIVKEFQKNADNSIEIQLSQKLRLYVPNYNDQGEEDPALEPVGGSVLIFGDDSQRLVFSPSKVNEVHIKGFSICARTPRMWVFLVGKWARPVVKKISIHGNTFSLTVHQIKEKTVSRLFSNSVKAWGETGVVIKESKRSNHSESLEIDYLEEKRKEIGL